MKKLTLARAGAIAAIGFCAASVSLAQKQMPSPAPTAGPKGAPMRGHATGTFDVKVVPIPSEDKAGGAVSGRMSIDKQIHGDLEGTSKGEMMTSMSAVEGSGVYVALERVTGKLRGRNGTFVLHHTGVMTRGAPQLTIRVVPDSGTGELEGLSGAIQIADGKHSYDFEYTLPEKP